MNPTSTLIQNDATAAGDDRDEPGSSPGAEPDPPPARPGAPEPAAVEVLPPPGAAAAGLDLSGLTERLRAAVDLVDHPVRRLTVKIVDDRSMSRLHGAHGGEAAPTDVLSFHLSEPDEPIDADVAVCLDQARRQAQQRGHGVERELLLYAIHGLLHGAGFDDRQLEGPRGFRAMHAEEDRLLVALGVGATFDRQPLCHDDGGDASTNRDRGACR